MVLIIYQAIHNLRTTVRSFSILKINLCVNNIFKRSRLDSFLILLEEIHSFLLARGTKATDDKIINGKYRH